MISYLVLCVFPAVSAVINVEISGSFHTNFTIKTLGDDRAIVTDLERISFKITDGVIKDCVKNYLGGRPDDLFVHRPTPWGDLFKIYGWSETYRVLTPISSRILNITSSPQLLRHEIETNKTEIKLYQTIYNSFATSWSNTLELSVKEINHHISVDNFKMDYVSPLGEKGERRRAITTGVLLSDVGGFGPVVVELYATRLSVKFEVHYQAKLWGNAVLNYDRSFRGHHFYSPNLEDIMFDCGLSNSLEIKEIIDVGFYTDAKVVIKNMNNGLMMLTRNIEIYPL